MDVHTCEQLFVQIGSVYWQDVLEVQTEETEFSLLHLQVFKYVYNIILHVESLTILQQYEDRYTSRTIETNS